MFKDIIFGNKDEMSSGEMIPLAAGIDNISIDDFDLPDELELLTLRNTVLFPQIVIPIAVGRKKSLKLIKEAHKKEILIGIISQKVENTEDPKFKDIYKVGTLARVIKLFDMPDGEKTAVLQGIARFEITEETAVKPNLKAKYKILETEKKGVNNAEFEAQVFSVKELSVIL